MHGLIRRRNEWDDGIEESCYVPSAKPVRRIGAVHRYTRPGGMQQLRTQTDN
jgi:hypothetical protein